MRFAGFLLLTYLIGSVNFAIVVLGLLGKGDPREAFSGNAGTTNVCRQAGKGWAAVVLILDVGRAAGLASLALALLPHDLVPWTGLVLGLGNRFPCFHRFKGGKGVAGYLGFTLPLAPWGTALSCVVWVVVHRMTRIPFVASFCMILILGGATVVAIGTRMAPVAGTVLTVLLIAFNHKGNIVSLAGKWRESSPVSPGEK